MTSDLPPGDNVIPFPGRTPTQADRGVPHGQHPADVGVHIDVHDGPGGEPSATMAARLPLDDAVRLLKAARRMKILGA